MYVFHRYDNFDETWSSTWRMVIYWIHYYHDDCVSSAHFSPLSSIVNCFRRSLVHNTYTDVHLFMCSCIYVPEQNQITVSRVRINNQRIIVEILLTAFHWNTTVAQLSISRYVFLCQRCWNGRRRGGVWCGEGLRLSLVWGSHEALSVPCSILVRFWLIWKKDWMSSL